MGGGSLCGWGEVTADVYAGGGQRVCECMQMGSRRAGFRAYEGGYVCMRVCVRAGGSACACTLACVHTFLQPSKICFSGLVLPKPQTGTSLGPGGWGPLI